MDLIDRQQVIRSIVTYSAKNELDAVAIAHVIHILEHTPSVEPDSNDMSGTQKALDTISRQAAIEALDSEITVTGKANAEAVRGYVNLVADRIKRLPSAEPEIIRCKDCFYGYLYSGVYDGTTCSWVECKKPDGLNRDVSIDGYCSAAIRRKDNG